MSWLQDLLSQGATPSGGFPLFPGEEDERKAAEQAARMPIRTGRRAPGEMLAQEPIPFPGIGMLNNPAGQAAPELPPSTNDPLSREPVPFKDGVPLPRARPEGPSPMSLAPINSTPADETALPPNATPTIGQAPPAPINQSPPDMPGTGGGILSKIFNPANAPMLMAMGGGFAGAPSLGTGMRRAFSAGAPQAALLRKEQLTLDSQNATARALRAKGIPEAEIIAASQNSEYLKALLHENFGGWKPVTVGEGPFGKNIVMSGPGGQVMPVEDYMRKFGVKAPPQTGVPGTSTPSDIPEAAIPVPQGTQSGILKSGLRYYNPGEADPQKYLDQFSPEMQSGMKNYLAGKSLPVSNPRQAGMAAEVRKYAPLYAEKAGIDHSEVAIKGRQQMETDLANTIRPATAGGQITFGGTTLGHLKTVAETANELKNSSILGVNPLSEGYNALWNSLSENKKKAVREFGSETGHYGQEVTKFYTGAPGGVEERLKFSKNMSTSQAPPVLAGSIRGELKLLPERFSQIYDNIEKQLGKDRADKELARAKVPEHVNQIKEQLIKLDPNGPEAEEKKLYGGKFAPIDLTGRPAPVREQPAPTAAPMAPGNYIFDPATGKMVKQ